MKRKIILIVFLLISLSVPLFPGGAARADAAKIYVAPLTGIVGVPMEEHVEHVFDEIGPGEDAIIIFKMDTPGGLADSMSRIMSLISDSDVPVVVWVAPSGARAASAGAFIVQAAHVAVMAPETNIGAAHPVNGSGEDIDGDEMNRKVVNDLLAKMRSFASERGRNAEVAENMVRDSVSLTAREAYEQYVIDLIASNEEELLEKLNGMMVSVKGRDVTIVAQNAEIVPLDMSFRLRAIEIFSRPDLAYLALLAGVMLIIMELKAPGGFVMGVTGGLLLCLAAYAFRVLPVNLAGLVLLIGGIVVILADFAIGGIGVLALPGMVGMITGGLLLFRAPGAEFLEVSASFVISATLVMGVTVLVVLRKIYKVMKRKPTSGLDMMVGERARVRGKADGGEDMALLHGEYWRVSREDGKALSEGDEIEVTRAESMMLCVKLVQSNDDDKNYTEV
ncbi:MAG: nodulation protein NfeD [Synergistaceae bacterium]|jgi:membrane-bound serine protease (ClpP class)|nr:nodulation protein NfeD [Synergistaceae bacterium]